MTQMEALLIFVRDMNIEYGIGRSLELHEVVLKF